MQSVWHSKHLVEDRSSSRRTAPEDGAKLGDSHPHRVTLNVTEIEYCFLGGDLDGQLKDCHTQWSQHDSVVTDIFG